MPLYCDITLGVPFSTPYPGSDHWGSSLNPDFPSLCPPVPGSHWVIHEPAKRYNLSSKSWVCSRLPEWSTSLFQSLPRACYHWWGYNSNTIASSTATWSNSLPAGNSVPHCIWVCLLGFKYRTRDPYSDNCPENVWERRCGSPCCVYSYLVWWILCILAYTNPSLRPDIASFTLPHKFIFKWSIAGLKRHPQLKNWTQHSHCDSHCCQISGTVSTKGYILKSKNVPLKWYIVLLCSSSMSLIWC